MREDNGVDEPWCNGSELYVRYEYNQIQIVYCSLHSDHNAGNPVGASRHVSCATWNDARSCPSLDWPEFKTSTYQILLIINLTSDDTFYLGDALAHGTVCPLLFFLSMNSLPTRQHNYAALFDKVLLCEFFFFGWILTCAWIWMLNVLMFSAARLQLTFGFSSNVYQLLWPSMQQWHASTFSFCE